MAMWLRRLWRRRITPSGARKLLWRPGQSGSSNEQSGLGFDYARLDGGRFLVAEIGNYLAGIYRPKSCGLQQAHGGFSFERCGNAIISITLKFGVCNLLARTIDEPQSASAVGSSK